MEFATVLGAADDLKKRPPTILNYGRPLFGFSDGETEWSLKTANTHVTVLAGKCVLSSNSSTVLTHSHSVFVMKMTYARNNVWLLEPTV